MSNASTLRDTAIDTTVPENSCIAYDKRQIALGCGCGSILASAADLNLRESNCPNSEGSRATSYE
jgi:hypothetical protein